MRVLCQRLFDLCYSSYYAASKWADACVSKHQQICGPEVQQSAYLLMLAHTCICPLACSIITDMTATSAYSSWLAQKMHLLLLICCSSLQAQQQQQAKHEAASIFRPIAQSIRVFVCVCVCRMWLWISNLFRSFGVMTSTF